jgi:aldehyde:ferredoxin oxidoreductase
MGSAGACAFSSFCIPPDALKGLIRAVAGIEIDVVRTGKRILNMNHLLNLREGLKPAHDLLPLRSVGKPPLNDGPLSGRTVNHVRIAENFFEAIGCDRETMMPDRDSLQDMELSLEGEF